MTDHATAPLTEPRKELQAPPPLQLVAPVCPMCLETTQDNDGGWECLTCKASWSGIDIGWEQDWQCTKPLGHDGDHHSATGSTWPNPWLIQSDPETVVSDGAL